MKNKKLLFLYALALSIHASENAIDLTATEGESPVFTAIYHNNLEELKKLYPISDMWLFNSKGLSPLAFSIYSAADLSIIEYIVNLNPQCVHFKGKKDTIKIDTEHFSLFEILLKKTPLSFYHKMIFRKQELKNEKKYDYLEPYLKKVALLLFENGASLCNYTQDQDGLLIEFAKGTCLYNTYKNNSYNQDGLTNLHVAIHNKNYYEIEKLLQEDAGVNVPGRYHCAYRPAELAIAKRDQAALWLLLKHGAYTSFRGNTLLKQAVIAYDIKSVKLLLEHGADPSLDNPCLLSYLAPKDHKLYQLLVTHGVLEEHLEN